MKNAEETALLIDAGNTCMKWAILKGESLSHQQRIFYSDKTPLQQFSDLVEKQSESSANIFLVSVLGAEFNQQAQKTALNYYSTFNLVKSIASLAGIDNAYDEPHKLGSDRFIAMIGAYHLSNKQQKKKKACIIVDSGTATTIDAVDAQGKHLGGLIMSGLDLCSRSLLQNTQQLPLWGNPLNQNKFECKLFSTNTIDAIQSASILGLSGAIEQISLKMESEIKSKEGHIQVDKYLCGGATKTLLPFLNSHFICQENLVMLGLKVVAESQNDK